MTADYRPTTVMVVVVTAFLVIGLIGVALFGDSVGTRRTIPQCHEDAVLIGVGDFIDGRWTEYACGPSVDDFSPSERSIPPTP